MKNGLVAVSGGSDSLALLDMLNKKNEYNLIVCHVNYNYRDTAIRDEKIVRDFCNKKNIKLYVLSLDSKNAKYDNFEDWARVKRYKFFKEIYDKENCECLFVGHHKDDFIETYLMQKKRGAIVECFGINKVNNLQNMKVIRPLLEYTKKDLEDYCKNNGIKYGIDETNYDTSYSRNSIRENIINKMSKEEKDQLFEQINELNIQKNKEVMALKELKSECLESKNSLNLDKFNQLNNEQKSGVLYYFIIDNVYKKISIKASRLLDMIKKIDSNKPNILLATYDNLEAYKEYNRLVISPKKSNYCYKIEDENVTNIDDKFLISKSGKKLEKVIARRDEFPLFIKNYDGSNKDINRLFIDKKVPLKDRKNWPVVVNNFGALLLVINIKKFYNDIDNFHKEIIEFYISKK